MMRYVLGLEKPDPKRALISALTIAGAYIAGGLIPLSPYIVLSQAATVTTARSHLTTTTLSCSAKRMWTALTASSCKPLRSGRTSICSMGKSGSTPRSLRSSRLRASPPKTHRFGSNAWNSCGAIRRSKNSGCRAKTNQLRKSESLGKTF